MRRWALRLGVGLVLLLAGAIGIVTWIGGGGPGKRWQEGTPTDRALSAETVGRRTRVQSEAAVSAGAPTDRQILFGDLHAHTTFSLDAFVMGMPITGGAGARPVSDACECFDRPDTDDCLAPTEERAWSSPIFVAHDGTP